MYKSIQLQLLLYLSTEDVYTSNMLANKVKKSPRTIKSGMKEIREIAKDFGMEIDAIRGQGYRATIIDQDLFNQMYERHLIKAEIFDNNYTLTRQRVYQIILILLQSEGRITHGEIADKLYLSKSSITHEIKMALEFLDSYHFDVVNSPNYGISVKGNEGFLRLAYTEMYGIHYSSYHVETDNPLMAIYRFDPEKRDHIRQIIISSFIENELSIYDDDTQRLAIYLTVAVNRVKEGHYIPKVVNEEKLKNSLHFPIARHILDQVSELMNVDFTENEALFFTKIIIPGTDLYNNKFAQEQIILDARQKALDSISTVRTLIGPTVMQDIDAYDPGIVEVVTKLVIKVQFGLASCRQNPMQSSTFPRCTISTIFADKVIKAIEKGFDVEIAYQHRFRVEVAVFNFVMTQKLNFTRANIVVASERGRRMAQVHANRIKRFDDILIESAQAYELYEVKGLNPDKIDLIIHDLPEIAYQYDIPYHTLTKKELYINDINEIAIRIARKNFDFMRKIEAVDIKFMKDLKFKNKDDLSNKISKRYASYDSSYGTVKEYVSNYMDINGLDISSRIIPVFIPIDAADQHFIDIYQHNHKDNDLYVAVVGSSLSNLEEVKELMILFRVLSSEYYIVDEMFTTEQTDDFYDAVAAEMLLFVTEQPLD